MAESPVSPAHNITCTWGIIQFAYADMCESLVSPAHNIICTLGIIQFACADMSDSLGTMPQGLLGSHRALLIGCIPGG